MAENGSLRLLHKEGVDVSPDKSVETFQILLKLANDNFSDTGFTKKGLKVTDGDLKKVELFYHQASELSPEVFNLSTQEHLHLTERYMELFVKLFNRNGKDLDINLAKSLGLLHDVGRTYSHRRSRNDRIGHMLLEKSGFKSDYLRNFVPDEVFSPAGSDQMTPEEIAKRIADPSEVIGEGNYYRAISVVSDVLAKFLPKQGSEGRRLRRWSEVVSEATKRQNLPVKSDMWPSEYKRQQVITSNLPSVAKFYESVGNWVENETGVKLEDVINLMESDLEINPMHKAF